MLKTPVSADLAITSRCNLRCTYCSHFSSAGDVNRDLPLAEWLGFFEELRDCAVFSVTLQGGEPFCRQDLREIIEGIVRNRMRFAILSNGILIDEAMAAFLAATGRCNGIQISIDGSGPVTHDTFRGEGNFRKAIRGLEVSLKHGLSVSVRVTIHRENVNDLEGIAAYLLEEIGLENFSTNAASHMGLCRQNARMVQLTTEERSFAMEVLLRLNARYDGRITADAGPLAEARTWLMMEQARREGRDGLPGAGYLSACGGPMQKIAVRSDGILVPCIQMSHIELGRINRDGLRDVWQEHPALIGLRKRREVSLADFEFCRGCAYIRYCTGNCPALAYLMVGDVIHPSPDGCLRLFLEQGGRLPDGNVLETLPDLPRGC
jgi:SynChlorMet cassette radical SAM/SPASM protein ScmE